MKNTEGWKGDIIQFEVNGGRVYNFDYCVHAQDLISCNDFFLTKQSGYHNILQLSVCNYRRCYLGGTGFWSQGDQLNPTSIVRLCIMTENCQPECVIQINMAKIGILFLFRSTYEQYSEYITHVSTYLQNTTSISIISKYCDISYFMNIIYIMNCITVHRARYVLAFVIWVYTAFLGETD